MTRNAYAPLFRPPWAPSRAQQLVAFRAEQRRRESRPSAKERGYDDDWRALRKLHLAEEPNCRMCARLGKETAARMVDHIEPVSDAPHRRLDPSNLQSLCWPHHNSKTQKDQRQSRPR
jgi:5-methylcytosine-specific restriction protein A